MCRHPGTFFFALLTLWPRHVNATIADGRADAVFGQPDFTTGTAPTTASALNVRSPLGIVRGYCLGIGGVNLVVDSGHHRALVLKSIFDAATGVVGQPTFFASSTAEPTEDTLNAPSGAAMDATRYAIADTGNHRVVIGGCGAGSSDVLGQKTFYTAVPNAGGVSATSMSGPRGVGIGGSLVYVSDTDNHRVLLFDLMSATPGTAIACLGQKDCTTSTPSGGTPAFNAPSGIAVSGSRVLIADTGNDRVVELLGTSFIATYGGSGPVALTTMKGPTGVSFDGSGGFWVVDQGNRRVLHFANKSKIPNLVLGQNDFKTAEIVTTPRDNRFVLPTSVASLGGETIVVSDTGAHRLLQFSFACAPGICDDGDPCTDDTCSPVGGGVCSHSTREYSQQCAPYACDFKTRTCTNSCAARPCAPGYRCTTAFKQCIKICGGSIVCGVGETCIDGICCSTPCDGKCESCTLPGNEGTCIPINGRPRRPCAVPTECGGSCDGRDRKECTPMDAGFTCGAEVCENGVELRRGKCDGVGTCLQDQRACAPFACGAGSCNSTCRFDFDCDPNARCDGGTCVATLRASGEGCSHAGAFEGTSVTLLLWAISAASAALRRRQRT
jgi:hypothetical protein